MVSSSNPQPCRATCRRALSSEARIGRQRLVVCAMRTLLFNRLRSMRVALGDDHRALAERGQRLVQADHGRVRPGRPSRAREAIGETGNAPPRLRRPSRARCAHGRRQRCRGDRTRRRDRWDWSRRPARRPDASSSAAAMFAGSIPTLMACVGMQLRRDEDRTRADQDQPGQHRHMRIPRHDDGIARLQQGEQQGVIAARRAVDHDTRRHPRPRFRRPAFRRRAGRVSCRVVFSQTSDRKIDSPSSSRS